MLKKVYKVYMSNYVINFKIIIKEIILCLVFCSLFIFCNNIIFDIHLNYWLSFCLALILTIITIYYIIKIITRVICLILPLSVLTYTEDILQYKEEFFLFKTIQNIIKFSDFIIDGTHGKIIKINKIIFLNKYKNDVFQMYHILRKKYMYKLELFNLQNIELEKITRTEFGLIQYLYDNRQNICIIKDN